MDFTKVKENLEKKGFAVSCFATGGEATAYLLEELKDKVVAFGGSMTLRDLGLYEKLTEQNKALWHWMGDTTEQAKEAEVYLSSVNGLAETGEIINIDGHCNRVSGTLYGHKKVYFVVGRNKLAADFHSSLHRARNIAAPLNARRLGKNTPCATGELRCHDCQSPERICRALTVLWTKPTSCPYEVVLIDEDLGY